MPRFGFPLDRLKTNNKIQVVTSEEMKTLFLASGKTEEQAEMQLEVCRNLGSQVLIGEIFYSLKKDDENEN